MSEQRDVGSRLTPLDRAVLATMSGWLPVADVDAVARLYRVPRATALACLLHLAREHFVGEWTVTTGGTAEPTGVFGITAYGRIAAALAAEAESLAVDPTPAEPG